MKWWYVVNEALSSETKPYPQRVRPRLAAPCRQHYEHSPLVSCQRSGISKCNGKMRGRMGNVAGQALIYLHFSWSANNTTSADSTSASSCRSSGSLPTWAFFSTVCDEQACELMGDRDWLKGRDVQKEGSAQILCERRSIQITESSALDTATSICKPLLL